MSKTALLLLAGVLVVVAGGIYTMQKGKMAGEDRMMASSQMSQSEDGTSGMRGSMKDLMAREGSWKCEFTHKTDVSDSTGIVYISNGMMRGNFLSQVPQLGEVKSYMVTRDGFVHTWSDMMPQGVKMPVVAAEGSASTEGQADIYNQELDYNCMSWEADVSMFELPQTVVFMEMGAQ